MGITKIRDSDSVSSYGSGFSLDRLTNMTGVLSPESRASRKGNDRNLIVDGIQEEEEESLKRKRLPLKVERARKGSTKGQTLEVLMLMREEHRGRLLGAKGSSHLICLPLVYLNLRRRQLLVRGG